MHKILLVEDNVDAYNLVKRALGSSQLEWAKSLAEATRLLQTKQYDLILLDIMLPDGDGYRLCSVLQTNDQLNNCPVIFLTAKNSTLDKVMGFSVGADDFISKPFDPLELKARVDAKLRKRERDMIESDMIRVGDIEINRNTQRVSINQNGTSENIDLTPIEFKLLVMLSKEPNTVHTRDQILNHVWGESIHVYGRSVDTHISKLRKKLGPKADYIESVHGSGYRFAVNEQQAPQIDVNLRALPV